MKLKSIKRRVCNRCVELCGSDHCLYHWVTDSKAINDVNDARLEDLARVLKVLVAMTLRFG